MYAFKFQVIHLHTIYYINRRFRCSARHNNIMTKSSSLLFSHAYFFDRLVIHLLDKETGEVIE